jgi:putative ABC transport system substrate-binding protein
MAGAHAQSEGKRLIGFAGGLSEAEWEPNIRAFSERLQSLGWPEKTFSIALHATGGNFERLDAEVATLVAAKPDVIIALGTPGLKSALRHTQVLPVIFIAVSDPVGQGLMSNIAHPDGNATGFTNFEFSLGSKWVDLLKGLDGRISHISLLINPANSNAAAFSKVISSAAQSKGIEIIAAAVTNATEIERTITECSAAPGGGLIVFPDSLPFVYRGLIIELTKRYRLPALYPFREFPVAGGLMSYGVNQIEVYRQAAVYADRIFRGAKPADLPVQAPNKFDLVINLKTAKALGLTIPLTLQASADEVIE